MTVASILQIERAKSYREGWEQGNASATDNAYLQGQSDLEERHWRECKRWWWFGLLCGITVAVLVWSFWP